MKSLFEQNGGNYRKQGDYLFPNFTAFKVFTGILQVDLYQFTYKRES